MAKPEVPKLEERRFGKLETIRGQGHEAPRLELEALSDDELKESIHNPAKNDRLTVKGKENLLRDGNGRVNAARKRGGFISDDDLMTVEVREPSEPIASRETDNDHDNSHDSDDTKAGENAYGRK
ncbi:hypothetical protein [Agrobacterium vitis]|uniref:hypothetical protein n=1 Tax=Agrobacterium vitis TaxID=373 RepID=UPI003D2DA877